MRLGKVLGSCGHAPTRHAASPGLGDGWSSADECEVLSTPGLSRGVAYGTSVALCRRRTSDLSRVGAMQCNNTQRAYSSSGRAAALLKLFGVGFESGQIREPIFQAGDALVALRSTPERSASIARGAVLSLRDSQRVVKAGLGAFARATFSSHNSQSSVAPGSCRAGCSKTQSIRLICVVQRVPWALA